MTNSLSRLSTVDLKTLASALRSGRLVSPFHAVALERILTPVLASAVSEDLRALEEVGVSASQLPFVLELLVRDRESRPGASDTITLVTTGPEAGEGANRDTSVVVRELFAQAERSVLVVGYVVYQGRRVFETLAERMEQLPGLRVRLCLNVDRPASDSSDSNELLRRYANRFTSQQWPPGKPLPEVYFDPRALETTTDKRACLHAKSVVVDGQHVFVSSANLTEAAQQRNIELGVLVRSKELGKKIEEHFHGLIAEGLLQTIFLNPEHKS